MAKYGLGTETTIRLEGAAGVQAAFEIIKSRIRSRLPAQAPELIDDIEEALKAL